MIYSIDMDADDILKTLQTGLLFWYDIPYDSKVLLVNQDSDCILDEYISNRCVRLKKCSISESFHETEKYDFVIAVGVLEKCIDPVIMLNCWFSLLVDNGKLLLATGNRMAVKYFCGETDPFTNRQFDNLEDYRNHGAKIIKNLGGRLYGMGEIRDMLSSAHILNQRFYSVMPSLDRPQLIYAEDFLPNEELANRYYTYYDNPSGVFLNEEFLYSSLIKNGLFHQMANAYFIECPKKSSDFADVNHVTLALDRGEKNSIVTIIKKSGKVIKKNVFEEGKSRLENMKKNLDDLGKRGLNVVNTRILDDCVIMDFVDAPNAVTALQNLARTNKDEFIEAIDHLRDLYYKSSEKVDDGEYGPVLEKVYMDLNPINAFYKDGDFIFYDQEMYAENFPVNVILFRSIAFVYYNNPSINEIVPQDFFWERYNIAGKIEKLCEYSDDFVKNLLNQDCLSEFNNLHRGNHDLISKNRNLLQTSSNRHKFIELCMEECYSKKIIVFGSGRYADKFIDFYKDEFEISFAVDNNSQRWGQQIQGIDIYSPDELKKINKDVFKLIICVKDYDDILNQILLMGFENIGIFDSYRVYDGRQKFAPKWADASMKNNLLSRNKPYHIGYIAGVFDLFHIGHLNMFKRAKEQCDYLIAAVVSDEGVRKWKKVEPYVPFEERIAMVQSCQYVDEAVRIPLMYGGTIDAFRKYHFDCQFSGSDYENDPFWLDMKQQLENYGSTMVFFPYTQQTSSTKLKAAINNAIPVIEDRTETENRLTPPQSKTYRLGYYPAVIALNDDGLLNHLRNLYTECERLVVGIPNDIVTSRLYGDNVFAHAEEIKNWLESHDFIDHVEILENQNLLRQEIYSKVNYDITWYGGIYGEQFIKDKSFMAEKGIEFRSLMPDVIQPFSVPDSLEIALKNACYKNKKIVLWGTGKYFDIYMQRYGQQYRPSYAVDNNPDKWNTKKDGIDIFVPGNLRKETKENTLVVICMKNYGDILQFLRDLGDFEYRPMLFSNSIQLLDEYSFISGSNIKAKYNLGFALSSLAHANEESAAQMRALAEQCECFVLGIPSDYVMARIFGGGMNGYNSESVAAWWKSLGFVSDVLILDKLELGYQAVYERLHFDACFYGSEYGSQFEEDARFFAEKGVHFVSIIPSKRMIFGDGDGLKLALQNVRKDQKIVLFGSGNYFDIFMQNYSMVHPVAYAVDNDAGKWNKKKNGVHILSPESLKKENPSDVLVVICAKNYREMKQQLADLGNYNSRTLVYSNEQTLLEEYYISCCKEEAYIKQAQSGLMLLLKEFDRVCKKYNLKYFIICGSLIGVIRHKGFIPWDDDMDLAMTWEDYLKLKKVAKKEWKNSKFHILHYNGLGNGAFLDFMPRLVYMDEYFPTKVYDKVSGKCNPKFEHRMFLDIYPMLNASKNNKKHNFYMNFMKGVYNLCMGHRAFVNYEDYARMPENTVKLMKFINTCGKFLPSRFLTWWYMMLANYAKHEKCDEYFMPSCAITCIERKFKKEWFGNGTYLPFGDMEVMVPEKYGELLEGMGYHGYMNFPPLHIRKPSHYFNSDIEIW